MSHETFHFLHQTVSSFSPVVSDGTFRKTPSKLDSYALLSCDQNMINDLYLILISNKKKTMRMRTIHIYYLRLISETPWFFVEH